MVDGNCSSASYDLYSPLKEIINPPEKCFVIFYPELAPEFYDKYCALDAFNGVNRPWPKTISAAGSE